jgi:hypothetical protein
MRYVGTGITRHVLLVRSVVVKLPRINYGWEKFLQGLLANIQENKTHHYSNGIHDMLCPVLFSFAGIIHVQKRAERTFIEAEMSELTIPDAIKGDDKAGNWGILNGKVVKLDYGSI